jgi:hypothetical protein
MIVNAGDVRLREADESWLRPNFAVLFHSLMESAFQTSRIRSFVQVPDDPPGARWTDRPAIVRAQSMGGKGAGPRKYNINAPTKEQCFVEGGDTGPEVDLSIRICYLIV